MSDRYLIRYLIRERDEALAEVERLRTQNAQMLAALKQFVDDEDYGGRATWDALTMACAAIAKAGKP